MKSILFAGDNLKGQFVKDLCNQRNYQYINVEQDFHVKKVVTDILFKSQDEDIKFIVVDVMQFSDSADEISKNLKKVNTLISDVTIIVLISGYDPNSEICKSLSLHDIKKYIYSATNGDLKIQLEDHITNNSEYSFDIQEEILKEKVVLEAEKEKNVIKTIAVAGVSRNVGTTTMAMQIVKYITMKGYKACYIEANNILYRNKSFIQLLEKWFDAKREKEKLVYNGIDIFKEEENINQILKKDYDFFVLDYGDMFDSSFMQAPFLREDLQILVSEAKVNHFDNLNQVITNVNYKDCILTITKVANHQKEDVINFLASIHTSGRDTNKDRIYISDVAFDMTKFTSNFLEEIFSLEEKEEKKKSGFFNKLLKKKNKEA